MKDFSFTIILANHTKASDDLANATFEAGCDDATVSSCDGVVSLDFHRRADSLDGALRSAVGQLASAGYQVHRVELGSEDVKSAVAL